MLLDGKAVVVTGAGRGLGEAFAVHAAQAGAAVVVNDVEADLAQRTAANIRAHGGRAVASGHSVAEPEQARAIVDLCVAEFGSIDGLVNNAGVNYEALPWQDDPAQVRELIEVNVLGVIYTGMAAAEAMADSGRGGSIVNVSSGASLGQRKLGAYAASKGAVASLTYSWALDMEDVGIRVNAVCPLAHTRMVWKSERSLRNCPPDRTPSRIAPLVLFLLGDGAHGITGQLIRCNGPQLHIVGQPYLKAPILERQVWDSESVQRAFDEVFSAHLEPYGLEKRVPPRLRKWTDAPSTPLRSA
ncbi:NAD(P)-dependent dehydrogenase (short-subunit alcohol dehydrogenase family) [Prauserella shujinwangii]|uniref:NAD(P)-dependent dehydrogenase (Short-subunit alcohol dehydrogenase family) n=1 Tax=Prauserella shujinwangii TaxID=1453103 RepID=A0A2T0LYX6_9PSEU|nr:SDR family NAD(P)-dependent oxidoreductase [Prauserella shujinwangii]PRX49314.1 NAD(P)-dependent dehydrogenase (short-subunit alcohol dehydrogenase family) [Prauserella shujinwangii]